MKKSLIYVVFLNFILVLTGCASPEAYYQVTVIDENENPLKDANVRIAFRELSSKAPGQGWGTVSKSSPVDIKSDENGFCEAKGRTVSEFTFFVTAEGYYKSYPRVFEKAQNYNKLLNRWEPWPCELTVRLKKIKDPVPMCVKSTDWMNVPDVGRSVGFDLEVGDWVSPYGKGKVSDFIFNLTARFKSPFDSEAKYEMTFSNPLDGIQEFKADPKDQSVFKYPYLAPQAGYLNEMSRFEFNKIDKHGDGAYKTDMQENREYFYRVRTKTDAQGNIISANYGYLTSELAVQRFKGGRIKFTYYFNPDNKSRSLEYNGVNLFEDRDVQGRMK